MIVRTRSTIDIMIRFRRQDIGRALGAN